MELCRQFGNGSNDQLDCCVLMSYAVVRQPRLQLEKKTA